jgi:hypothetical protein
VVAAAATTAGSQAAPAFATTAAAATTTAAATAAAPAAATTAAPATTAAAAVTTAAPANNAAAATTTAAALTTTNPPAVVPTAAASAPTGVQPKDSVELALGLPQLGGQSNLRSFVLQNLTPLPIERLKSLQCAASPAGASILLAEVSWRSEAAFLYVSDDRSVAVVLGLDCQERIRIP